MKVYCVMNGLERTDLDNVVFVSTSEDDAERFAYNHELYDYSGNPNIEVLDVPIRGVKKIETPQWIPLSESLPKDGTWNLFVDGKGRRSVERYKADAIDHFWPESRWFELEEAVAWMPLPEYEGE